MRRDKFAAPIWVPERNKKRCFGGRVVKQGKKLAQSDNYEKDRAEA